MQKNISLHSFVINFSLIFNIFGSVIIIIFDDFYFISVVNYGMNQSFYLAVFSSIFLSSFSFSDIGYKKLNKKKFSFCTLFFNVKHILMVLPKHDFLAKWIDLKVKIQSTKRSSCYFDKRHDFLSFFLFMTFIGQIQSQII